MSNIRFSSFPRTQPPPHFTQKVIDVFRAHEPAICTITLAKGLTSDQVLKELCHDLQSIGFEVETGKKATEKIYRPVFFGENGQPRLQYQIDAFQCDWKCGLEIEAGRGSMGNAVYRDLVQALVMVELKYLVLAVANTYKFGTQGPSKDYDQAVKIADALYGHSRIEMPYKLLVIGY